jgi:hypothetical protein
MLLLAQHRRHRGSLYTKPQKQGLLCYPMVIITVSFSLHHPTAADHTNPTFGTIIDEMYQLQFLLMVN